MDLRLEKLFEKLETLEDKRQDVLEEIKNRLYDMDLSSEEDDYEDEEFEEEEPEGTN